MARFITGLINLISCKIKKHFFNTPKTSTKDKNWESEEKMKTQGQYVYKYQYNKKEMQAWMFDKQGMNLVYKYLFTKMASCSRHIVSNIRSML